MIVHRIERPSQCLPHLSGVSHNTVFEFPLEGLPPGYLTSDSLLVWNDNTEDHLEFPCAILLLPRQQSEDGRIELCAPLRFSSRLQVDREPLDRYWGFQPWGGPPLLQTHMVARRTMGPRVYPFLDRADMLQETVRQRHQLRQSVGVKYWHVARLLGEL